MLTSMYGKRIGQDLGAYTASAELGMMEPLLYSVPFLGVPLSLPLPLSLSLSLSLPLSRSPSPSLSPSHF